MGKLVIDGARMEQLLRSPAGPVGRYVIGRAEVVKQGARAKAPRKTGCLQDSIVKRVEEDALTGFKITIVSDTRSCSPTRTAYSLYVHEGTAQHVIAAKGKALAFFTHPGTKAVPFLRDALPLAVA